MAINKILTETNLNKDNILSPIQYHVISHNRDIKNKAFLDKKVIYNSSLGSLTSINYDKEWHLKQSYIYNTLKIDELNQQSIENGLVPVFITITCPAEHHPSSKSYNPFISVSDSYEFLVGVWRDVYNNFRFDDKRVPDLKYIRVIEPHKSFVPHLHAVVYLPKYALVAFEEHYRKITLLYKINQTDYKLLDVALYATTYLLKYVQKTLEGDDMIRGWKIHHKISRVLTMSNLNIGLNREIFKRISAYVPYDKLSDLNYFRQIMSKVFIKRTIIDRFGELEREKTFGNSESSIIIDVDVKRVKKYTDYDGIDCVCYTYNEDEEFTTDITAITYNREHDCSLEVDIDGYDDGYYSYAVDSFVIHIDSIKVYDKKWFTMQDIMDYY